MCLVPQPLYSSLPPANCHPTGRFAFQPDGAPLRIGSPDWPASRRSRNPHLCGLCKASMRSGRRGGHWAGLRCSQDGLRLDDSGSAVVKRAAGCWSLVAGSTRDGLCVRRGRSRDQRVHGPSICYTSGRNDIRIYGLKNRYTTHNTEYNCRYRFRML